MAKGDTKNISAEQHQANKKAAQSRKRAGRGHMAAKVHQGPSIMELVSQDRREAAAADREARDIERAAQAAARAEATAKLQLQLALVAPQIVNDRANGGLDGLARDLAVDMINRWSVITNEVAAMAGTSRLSFAKKGAVTALFDRLAEKHGAADAEARLERLNGVVKVAESHARAAINFAWNKAKEQVK